MKVVGVKISGIGEGVLLCVYKSLDHLKDLTMKISGKNKWEVVNWNLSDFMLKR